MPESHPTNPHADALARLLEKAAAPVPWAGGGRLPWADPDFSRRLLATHLDPDSDQASRRPEIVAEHVGWLLERLAEALGPGPRHVLDAGCGPGLYCHELARRGHAATGLDVAPAALDWARTTAAADGLDCAFLEADLDAVTPDLADRLARERGPADAVTLWFGDFQGFRADRAEVLLRNLVACLRPGGLLLLEYQPLDHAVREPGTAWEVRRRGPFADGPHLWLQEYAWDEASATESHVHWILEIGSGTLCRYQQCHQGWADADLDRLLARCGLEPPVRHPPVTGFDPELEFPVLTARRAAAGRDDAGP